ncbi:MAG TPA: hypothetical protein ENG55_01335, partial [Candidatus Omnitrophica bacterium]|nr:hypothetical protein [Candidatus Omnitrophota bacterium]
MPIYEYKAKKGVDELVEGILSAESQEDAVNKLSQKGFFPIEIKEKEDSGDKRTKKILSQLLSKILFKLNLRQLVLNRVGSRQILVFTQKLATLMRAKIELLPALRILYEQTDEGDFKRIIQRLYNQVKKGIPLSRSLEEFPHIFSPLYTNAIKAGEASGSMDEALGNILDFIKRKEALKNKVSGALIYPSILLVVGFLSIIFVLVFVIPKLKGLFMDVNVNLHIFTKAILSVSAFTVNNWPYEA